MQHWQHHPQRSRGERLRVRRGGDSDVQFIGVETLLADHTPTAAPHAADIGLRGPRRGVDGDMKPCQLALFLSLCIGSVLVPVGFFLVFFIVLTGDLTTGP